MKFHLNASLIPSHFSSCRLCCVRIFTSRDMLNWFINQNNHRISPCYLGNKVSDHAQYTWYRHEKVQQRWYPTLTWTMLADVDHTISTKIQVGNCVAIRNFMVQCESYVRMLKQVEYVTWSLLNKFGRMRYIGMEILFLHIYVYMPWWRPLRVSTSNGQSGGWAIDLTLLTTSPQHYISCWKTCTSHWVCPASAYPGRHNLVCNPPLSTMKGREHDLAPCQRRLYHWYVR
jgi:hypothetical protein